MDKIESEYKRGYIAGYTKTPYDMNTIKTDKRFEAALYYAGYKDGAHDKKCGFASLYTEAAEGGK